jgi:hypothetical protein
VRGQVLVQGLSGVESIADLGTIDRLDPQRAFGIAREDLQQGDIASSAKRVDANGQVYYEWYAAWESSPSLIL